MGRLHVHFATGLSTGEAGPPVEALERVEDAVDGEEEGERRGAVESGDAERGKAAELLDSGDGGGGGNADTATPAQEPVPPPALASSVAADVAQETALVPEPPSVVSGMRASASMLVWVDLRRAARRAV